MFTKVIGAVVGIGAILGIGVWIGQKSISSIQSPTNEVMNAPDHSVDPVNGFTSPMMDRGLAQARVAPLLSVGANQAKVSMAPTMAGGMAMPEVDLKDPKVQRELNDDIFKLKASDRQALKDQFHLSDSQVQRLADVQTAFETELEAIAKKNMMNGGSQKEMDENVMRIDATYREGLTQSLGKENIERYMNFQMKRAENFANNIPTSSLVNSNR